MNGTALIRFDNRLTIRELNPMNPARPIEEIDHAVRMHVFGVAAKTARVPANAETAAALALPQAEVEESLRRLAAGKVLVLAPNNMNVWMANPFSAVPSAFKVRSRGLTYFAPCIWDALGIPAALDALKIAGKPADLLRETKERMFAA